MPTITSVDHGNSNLNWDNPAAWDLARVPQSGDDVVLAPTGNNGTGKITLNVDVDLGDGVLSIGSTLQFSNGKTLTCSSIIPDGTTGYISVINATATINADVGNINDMTSRGENEIILDIYGLSSVTINGNVYGSGAEGDSPPTIQLRGSSAPHLVVNGNVYGGELVFNSN